MSNLDKTADALVLTPIETAKLLRIGRGTVYEQIRLGSYPQYQDWEKNSSSQGGSHKDARGSER